MTRLQSLIFYLLIPAALAIQNGVRGSRFAPDLATERLIIFWMAMTLLSWGLADRVCWLLYRFSGAKNMRPTWAPRLVILPVGGLLAGIVCYFVIPQFLIWTDGYFGALHELAYSEGLQKKRPFLATVLGPSAIVAALMWTAINLAFDRLFGAPRFREVLPEEPRVTFDDSIPTAVADMPQPAAAQPAVPAAFLEKLQPDLGRDLIAVEAQEHYIKVYTRKGSELLHYRFKDAIKDLAPYDGLQVHRSHWVAKSGIAGIDTSSRSVRLTLRNGLQVPVSTAYRGALKMAGVIQTPP